MCCTGAAGVPVPALVHGTALRIVPLLVDPVQRERNVQALLSKTLLLCERPANKRT